MGDFKTLYKDADGRLRWETVDTLDCLRVSEPDEELERALREAAEADDATHAPSIAASRDQMRREEADDAIVARLQGERALAAKRWHRQREREEADAARIARNEELDDLYREPAENSPDGLAAIVQIERGSDE